jgi:hypothetical protein
MHNEAYSSPLFECVQLNCYENKYNQNNNPLLESPQLPLSNFLQHWDFIQS